MGEFRTNQTVLVKFEAILKALEEQHRWLELSNLYDMYSKYNSIYHLYGVIEYESRMKPGSYYVYIPGSGLDSSVWINEEDLSPYDLLNKEPERVDTDGDSEESKMLQDILNRVTSGMIITSDGKKFYLKTYEDLKGDKTKMDAYIPDSLLPKQIIYSDPATIVFWGDGTKTVVKKIAGEKFNPYHAFCAALAKKIFGSNAKVNRIVAKGEKRVSRKMLEATENAKKVAAAMMDDSHRELKDKEKVADKPETKTVCFDTFEKDAINNLNTADDIRREVKMDIFSIFNDVIKAELRKLFDDKK